MKAWKRNKVLTLILLVGIFLTYQYVFAAKAQSAGSNIWIIIDGPGAGVQVQSDTLSGTNIPNNLNSTIQANGNINPPSSDCAGDKSYYNGTLYGQADPGGCGWGHVVLYSDASSELQTITDALKNEEDARLGLMSDMPDYPGIEYSINRALNFLDFLIKDLNARRKLGIISNKTFKKLIRQIDSVYNLDSAVKNNYDVGVVIKPDLSVKDIKRLSTAYDIKVRIIQQIVNLEPLLKANP